MSEACKCGSILCVKLVTDINKNMQLFYSDSFSNGSWHRPAAVHHQTHTRRFDHPTHTHMLDHHSHSQPVKYPEPPVELNWHALLAKLVPECDWEITFLNDVGGQCDMIRLQSNPWKSDLHREKDPDWTASAVNDLASVWSIRFYTKWRRRE